MALTIRTLVLTQTTGTCYILPADRLKLQRQTTHLFALFLHMAYKPHPIHPQFDVVLHTRPTYWHCEPGWEWRSPPLADHLFWYVMDGIGSMRLNGEVWPLQAGSCFVFKPDSQPHGTQDPDQRLVVFGMHFDVVDLQGQPIAPTKDLMPPPGHIIRDGAFLTTMAQHCDTSFRYGDVLGGLQSCLLLKVMIIHLLEEIQHPPPSSVDRALNELVGAIQREPSRRWTVSELAQQAHLSQAQFVRRFRAITGSSPIQFMIQARLERARHLIQETDMSLTQIAIALGYDDVFFFSRQYKRYTGNAPSALRRR